MLLAALSVAAVTPSERETVFGSSPQQMQSHLTLALARHPPARARTSRILHHLCHHRHPSADEPAIPPASYLVSLNGLGRLIGGAGYRREQYSGGATIFGQGSHNRTCVSLGDHLGARQLSLGD